jgi:hypothetical protein
LLVTAAHVWFIEHVWQAPAQSTSRQQPPAAMQDVVEPTVQDCVFGGQV